MTEKILTKNHGIKGLLLISDPIYLNFIIYPWNEVNFCSANVPRIYMLSLDKKTVELFCLYQIATSLDKVLLAIYRIMVTVMIWQIYN